MAKRTKKPPPNLTSTILAPANAGRVKTVFNNTDECCHRWAANTQRDGRAGNVMFADGVIYSYGAHFPMARHVRLPDGRAAVLATTRRYSSSTSSHQTAVRGAIPTDTPVFYVTSVMGDGEAEHRANFEVFRADMVSAIEQAAKPRVKKGRWLSEAVERMRRGNEYAEAVGLADRLAAPDGGDTETWAAKIRDYLAAEQAVAFKQQQKLAAERAKKLVKVMREWRVKLAEWQDGGEFPGYPPDGSRETFLRIKGKVLETSRRAAVPLRAAMPILKAVRQEKNLADDFKVDGFRLQGIDFGGRLVTVGCHVVTFDEILRLAKRHNL